MSVYSVLKLRNDYTVFEELPTSVGDLTVVNAVLRGDAWPKTYICDCQILNRRQQLLKYNSVTSKLMIVISSILYISTAYSFFIIFIKCHFLITLYFFHASMNKAYMQDY